MYSLPPNFPTADIETLNKALDSFNKAEDEKQIEKVNTSIGRVSRFLQNNPKWNRSDDLNKLKELRKNIQQLENKCQAKAQQIFKDLKQDLQKALEEKSRTCDGIARTDGSIELREGKKPIGDPRKSDEALEKAVEFAADLYDTKPTINEDGSHDYSKLLDGTIHGRKHCFVCVELAKKLANIFEQGGISMSAEDKRFIALLSAFHDASRVHEEEDKEEHPNAEFFYNFALANGMSEEDAILGGLLIANKSTKAEKLGAAVDKFLEGCGEKKQNDVLIKEKSEAMRAKGTAYWVDLIKKNSHILKILNVADTIDVMRVRLSTFNAVKEYHEEQKPIMEKYGTILSANLKLFGSYFISNSPTGEFGADFVSNKAVDFLQKPEGAINNKAIKEKVKELIIGHQKISLTRKGKIPFKNHRRWELASENVEEIVKHLKLPIAKEISSRGFFTSEQKIKELEEQIKQEKEAISELENGPQWLSLLQDRIANLREKLKHKNKHNL